MGFAEEVAVGVVIIVAAGFLGWLALPILNRLEPRRMALTRDHGISVRTYTQPADLKGIPGPQILELGPWMLEDSDFYFSDGIPGDGPDEPTGWFDWSQHRGGEHAGWRHVLVRVQALQDRAVLLLHPNVVVSHTPANSDSGQIVGPQRDPGGNGLLCRQFEIELSNGTGQAVYHPGINAPNDETSQFPLRKGDSEAFVLIAHADAGRYEWSLEIHCLVDGRTVKLTIDDGGKPFVTVGPEGLGRSYWNFRDRRWENQPWTFVYPGMD